MGVAEDIDRLAAEGRLTSITLARRHGGGSDGWQCYLKLSLVDSYVAQIGDTPMAALAKAIEKLPSCEAYDLKFGAQAVTDRAKAAQAALCAECGEPQEETPSGAVCTNGHGGAAEAAGIFD